MIEAMITGAVVGTGVGVVCWMLEELWNWILDR